MHGVVRDSLYPDCKAGKTSCGAKRTHIEMRRFSCRQRYGRVSRAAAYAKLVGGFTDYKSSANPFHGFSRSFAEKHLWAVAFQQGYIFRGRGGTRTVVDRNACCEGGRIDRNIASDKVRAMFT